MFYLQFSKVNHFIKSSWRQLFQLVIGQVTIKDKTRRTLYHEISGIRDSKTEIIIGK